MKFFFYCPKCEAEKEVYELPRGTVGNLRDGYGLAIHHYECPKCHNLDAGYMNLIGYGTEKSESEQKEYIKDVIRMYQDIRGFKVNKS